MPEPELELKKGSAKVNMGNLPLIMGILNVTPDSFHDGGKYTDIDSAVKRAVTMKSQGADIIDVGGESTRPGAEAVPIDEELNRVIPVIKAISETDSSIIISVDTYKSKVAEMALKNGASIVNDISGLGFDRKMKDVVRDFDAGLIIMHMKGTPRNMQKNPVYDNVVAEIRAYLTRQVAAAVCAGIEARKIFVDPGIGFGKTLKHNLQILRNIDTFKGIGRGVLVGHSRKSMIGMLLDEEKTEDRLAGTLAVSAYLFTKDIDIIRVHDVKEHYELREVFNALKTRR